MPGWIKHENFVPDKTNRTFDLEMMKTNKAIDVTRTIKQDKSRLERELKNVSRDFKKRMNQLNNETNKWKKKAEKLRETKDNEDDMMRPSSQMLIRRRGSLDSSMKTVESLDFTRRRSRTMLSIDDIPGAEAIERGKKPPNAEIPVRRGSLDPVSLSVRQKEFLAKIAKLSSSQNSVTGDDESRDCDGDNDDEDASPPASPPPMASSRLGRRGSLPIMHLSVSRPPTSGQSLELIEEITRRGSHHSEDTTQEEDDVLNIIKEENKPKTVETEDVRKAKDTQGSQDNSKIKAGKILTKRVSIVEGPVIKPEASIKPHFARLTTEKSSVLKTPNLTLSLNPGFDKSSSRDDDSQSVASSTSGRRSRSNSLYDPRSARVTRRRNSTPGLQDLLFQQPQQQGPSLAEQFEQLKDCRYLRVNQPEDCDLSNVFC